MISSPMVRVINSASLFGSSVIGPRRQADMRLIVDHNGRYSVVPAEPGDACAVRGEDVLRRRTSRRPLRSAAFSLRSTATSSTRSRLRCRATRSLVRSDSTVAELAVGVDG